MIQQRGFDWPMIDWFVDQLFCRSNNVHCLIAVSFLLIWVFSWFHLDTFSCSFIEETEWDILRSCFADDSGQNDEFFSRIFDPGFRLRGSGETPPWSRDSLSSASRCRELIEQLTDDRASTKAHLLEDNKVTDNDFNTKSASTANSGLSYVVHVQLCFIYIYNTVALQQCYRLRIEWNKRGRKY